MKFIEYITGRFAIQPKNYFTDWDGKRKYKGVEVVEGILWKAGPFVFLFLY